MSHHLDSPLSRRDPRLNLTDLFVFGTPDATVLVADLNTSLAGAAPDFHPEARYEFRVHLDGAAREGLTYRFTFGVADGGTQPYQLWRVAEDGTEPLLGGRTGTDTSGSSGVRAWVGRAADPFFLDLDLLHQMNAAAERDEPPPLSGLSFDTARSSFAGSTVNALVVEVPHTDIELRPGRDLQVWAAVDLATDAGGWQQVNRAGLPMIWPVFRPADGEAASEANTTHPAQDRERYGKDVARTASALVAAAGTAPDPDAYGRSVARRLLPDLLPYTVGEPACFGFNGFCGRALGDDAAGVMFSLALNHGVSTGLTSRDQGPASSATFPYVVPATS